MIIYPLSAREQFDIMSQHLRGMKVRAADCFGSCEYLTEDGNKCAVGVLIPDGHPAQKHEAGVRAMLKDHPELKTRIYLDLACRMQVIHDIKSNWTKLGISFLEDKLRAVAETFKLELK